MGEGNPLKDQFKRTEDRVFALHKADPSSIPSILFGPVSLSGVIFE